MGAVDRKKEHWATNTLQYLTTNKKFYWQFSEYCIAFILTWETKARFLWLLQNIHKDSVTTRGRPLLLCNVTPILFLQLIVALVSDPDKTKPKVGLSHKIWNARQASENYNKNIACHSTRKNFKTCGKLYSAIKKQLLNHFH